MQLETAGEVFDQWVYCKPADCHHMKKKVGIRQSCEKNYHLSAKPYMSVKLEMLASVSGIEPLRLFWLSILVKKQKQKTGMSSHWMSIKQMNKDSSTYRSWSFESLPREAGIGPTNRLSSKSKLVNRERLPNCSGMPPVMLLPGNDLQYHTLHWSTKQGIHGDMI